MMRMRTMPLMKLGNVRNSTSHACLIIKSNTLIATQDRLLPRLTSAALLCTVYNKALELSSIETFFWWTVLCFQRCSCHMARQDTLSCYFLAKIQECRVSPPITWWLNFCQTNFIHKIFLVSCKHAFGSNPVYWKRRIICTAIGHLIVWLPKLLTSHYNQRHKNVIFYWNYVSSGFWIFVLVATL